MKRGFLIKKDEKNYANANMDADMSRNSVTNLNHNRNPLSRSPLMTASVYNSVNRFERLRGARETDSAPMQPTEIDTPELLSRLSLTPTELNSAEGSMIEQAQQLSGINSNGCQGNKAPEVMCEQAPAIADSPGLIWTGPRAQINGAERERTNLAIRNFGILHNKKTSSDVPLDSIKGKRLSFPGKPSKSERHGILINSKIDRTSLSGSTLNHYLPSGEKDETAVLKIEMMNGPSIKSTASYDGLYDPFLGHVSNQLTRSPIRNVSCKGCKKSHFNNLASSDPGAKTTLETAEVLASSINRRRRSSQSLSSGFSLKSESSYYPANFENREASDQVQCEDTVTSNQVPSEHHNQVSGGGTAISGDMTCEDTVTSNQVPSEHQNQERCEDKVTSIQVPSEYRTKYSKYSGGFKASTDRRTLPKSVTIESYNEEPEDENRIWVTNARKIIQEAARQLKSDFLLEILKNKIFEINLMKYGYQYDKNYQDCSNSDRIDYTVDRKATLIQCCKIGMAKARNTLLKWEVYVKFTPGQKLSEVSEAIAIGIQRHMLDTIFYGLGYKTKNQPHFYYAFSSESFNSADDITTSLVEKIAQDFATQIQTLATLILTKSGALESIKPDTLDTLESSEYNSYNQQSSNYGNSSGTSELESCETLTSRNPFILTVSEKVDNVKAEESNKTLVTPKPSIKHDFLRSGARNIRYIQPFDNIGPVSKFSTASKNHDIEHHNAFLAAHKLNFKSNQESEPKGKILSDKITPDSVPTTVDHLNKDKDLNPQTGCTIPKNHVFHLTKEEQERYLRRFNTPAMDLVGEFGTEFLKIDGLTSYNWYQGVIGQRTLGTIYREPELRAIAEKLFRGLVDLRCREVIAQTRTERRIDAKILDHFQEDIMFFSISEEVRDERLAVIKLITMDYEKPDPLKTPKVKKSILRSQQLSEINSNIDNIRQLVSSSIKIPKSELPVAEITKRPSGGTRIILSPRATNAVASSDGRWSLGTANAVFQNGGTSLSELNRNSSIQASGLPLFNEKGELINNSIFETPANNNTNNAGSSRRSLPDRMLPKISPKPSSATSGSFSATLGQISEIKSVAESSGTSIGNSKEFHSKCRAAAKELNSLWNKYGKGKEFPSQGLNSRLFSENLLNSFETPAGPKIPFKKEKTSTDTKTTLPTIREEGAPSDPSDSSSKKYFSISSSSKSRASGGTVTSKIPPIPESGLTKITPVPITKEITNNTTNTTVGLDLTIHENHEMQLNPEELIDEWKLFPAEFGMEVTGQIRELYLKYSDLKPHDKVQNVLEIPIVRMLEDEMGNNLLFMRIQMDLNAEDYLESFKLRQLLFGLAKTWNLNYNNIFKVRFYRGSLFIDMVIKLATAIAGAFGGSKSTSTVRLTISDPKFTAKIRTEAGKLDHDNTRFILYETERDIRRDFYTNEQIAGTWTSLQRYQHLKKMVTTEKNTAPQQALERAYNCERESQVLDNKRGSFQDLLVAFEVEYCNFIGHSEQSCKTAAQIAFQGLQYDSNQGVGTMMLDYISRARVVACRMKSLKIADFLDGPVSCKPGSPLFIQEMTKILQLNKMKDYLSVPEMGAMQDLEELYIYLNKFTKQLYWDMVGRGGKKTDTPNPKPPKGSKPDKPKKKEKKFNCTKCVAAGRPKHAATHNKEQCRFDESNLGAVNQNQNADKNKNRNGNRNNNIPGSTAPGSETNIRDRGRPLKPEETCCSKKHSYQHHGNFNEQKAAYLAKYGKHPPEKACGGCKESHAYSDKADIQIICPDVQATTAKWVPAGDYECKRKAHFLTIKSRRESKGN